MRGRLGGGAITGPFGPGALFPCARGASPWTQRPCSYIICRMKVWGGTRLEVGSQVRGMMTSLFYVSGVMSMCTRFWTIFLNRIRGGHGGLLP